MSEIDRNNKLLYKQMLVSHSIWKLGMLKGILSAWTLKSGKPDFETKFYMNLLPIEKGILLSLSELRIKWDYGCIWEVPGT